MVRLKDIAARAGVSVMTVSKVLREAPDVSNATRVRVKVLAEQMGYVPNSVAQGLRSRTSKLFGLVISTSSNPIFSRIISAIEEASHESGYQLILCHTLNLPDREEAVIRRLLSRRIEGLFLSPVYRLSATASIYDELRRQGLPTVILGHRAPFCAQFVNVETDDYGGSYQAARHLLDCGHKRIAYLRGPVSSPAAQERFEGFRRALREASIELDDKWVFSAGNTIEEGATAASQLLSENPPITAVQCVNDLCAIGAANLFLNQGLRIPEDLSVFGFGNILLSEYFRVPLSTVRQPKHRLGAAAMDIMKKMLRKELFEPRRLQSELVLRASTASPSTV